MTTRYGGWLAHDGLIGVEMSNSFLETDASKYSMTGRQMAKIVLVSKDNDE